jgi:1,4-dihydroxy-6-naphthoate synthase
LTTRKHKLPERLLSLAHSADADDAFMFQPLLDRTVDTGNARFKSVISDIETLNQAAQKAQFDVTAISLHGYAFVQKLYRPLSAGASVGDNYGPMLVAKKAFSNIRGRTIAVPGLKTTAYLLLKLFEPDCETVEVPFDQIIQAVQAGDAEVGLIIHEGQVTYRDHKLQKVIDLGSWWYNEMGLPVVLGLVAVKRSFPPEVQRIVQNALKASVDAAIKKPEAALNAAAKYSRGMDRGVMKKFVNMYVNEYTIDLGEGGRRSAEHLLSMAYERQLIPSKPKLDFVY